MSGTPRYPTHLHVVRDIPHESVTTRETSAHNDSIPGYQPGMSDNAHPAKKSRIRPQHQSAQVLLRMSPDERTELQAGAKQAGYASVGAYLLALHAARRGAVTDHPSGAMVPETAKEPAPRGADSDAMARRAMPVAAG